MDSEGIFLFSTARKKTTLTVESKPKVKSVFKGIKCISYKDIISNSRFYVPKPAHINVLSSDRERKKTRRRSKKTRKMRRNKAKSA